MGCFVRGVRIGMGCFVRGDKSGMGCFVRGDKNCMGCFVRGGKSMRDVLSGVAKNGMGCFVPGCFVLHSRYTSFHLKSVCLTINNVVGKTAVSSNYFRDCVKYLFNQND